MAETTVLRSSANVRNASPGATSAQPHAQMSGGLPMVNVNMNAGGPQVQGAQQTARQGVMILPPKAGTQRFTTGGLPNQGAKSAVVILPRKDAAPVAMPSLNEDQTLLCRHLAEVYLDNQRALAGSEGAEENVKIAEGLIATLDAMLAASTAAAAAAEAAAAAAAATPPQQQIRPAIAAGRSNNNASAGPRRVTRPVGPSVHPMVTVTMDAKQPVVTVQDGPPPHLQSQPAQDAAPRRVVRPTAPTGAGAPTDGETPSIIDVG